MWKQYTLGYPQDGSVRLKLGSEVVTLEDALDRITVHFQQRQHDLFLTERLDSLLHGRDALRGMELKKGQIQFDGFPSTCFPTDPTWAESPFNDRAWEWNLHTLVVLRYLLAANRKTGDAWYLSRAEELLSDWIEDNYHPEPPSEFSWSDHSTALRLENVIYHLAYVRHGTLSQELVASVMRLISTHAAVLSDPAFYNKHTNHGLDQSYVLYLAGAAFPEFENAPKWQSIGRDRTIDELSFAFTSEGVHVENSPTYHFITLRRAILARETFRQYDGDQESITFRTVVDKALRFAAHVVRPDGKLPILGDSQSVQVKTEPAFRLASGLNGYEEFLYSVSQGRQGTKPRERFVVFPDSGYAIIRDTWDQEACGRSLHLLFKAGFLSAYHKHDDDLSFVLYNGGEEWIIDSGMYKYHERDPLRQYMRSARAHNVVVVDDTQADREWGDLGRSRIDDFEVSGESLCVRASHSLFPGVTASRELTYEHEVVRIRDVLEVSDGSEHRFRALFHIPYDKHVTVTGDAVEIISTKTDRRMYITPIQGAFANIDIVAGHDVTEVQGWVSNTYGVIEKATCVVFECYGNRYESEIELRFGRSDEDSMSRLDSAKCSE